MVKKDLTKLSIIIGIAIVVFLPSFAKYQELRHKNKMLDRKIRLIKADIARLDAQKLRLETDISYIEKRAREKIGVVRKGEIVIKSAAKK